MYREWCTVYGEYSSLTLAEANEKIKIFVGLKCTVYRVRLYGVR